MTDLISLGKTGLQISPLGLGTWQWGDRMMWGYGKTYTDADIQAAFQAGLAGGINWFDTAEVYGLGVSERLLGTYVQASNPSPLVATKFFPFPWRLAKAQLLRALRGSLKRMGLEKVDLYQVHWPMAPVAVESWADALGQAVQSGLAQAVGVSNYNADQMLRAEIALSKRGVVLASNQVPYNLVTRGVERSGLLQLCHERGITLIAYSPLAQGVLTGKYTAENLPPGLRGRRYPAASLAKIEPLIARLRTLGVAHGGKTPAQVALNWLICKGAVPIPGAKNARQVEESVGALGWRLTPEEVAELDQASDEIGA